jgi:hypothetical protein
MLITDQKVFPFESLRFPHQDIIRVNDKKITSDRLKHRNKPGVKLHWSFAGSFGRANAGNSYHNAILSAKNHTTQACQRGNFGGIK